MMPIHGELEEISLPAFIQVLCMQPRRSAVKLRSPEESGMIVIDRGQIVKASVGPVDGEQAFHRLLSWTRGSFRVTDPEVATKELPHCPGKRKTHLFRAMVRSTLGSVVRWGS